MVCLVFDSYSLAPENPYPAALNDAISVMRHVFEHSAEMAIDPNNVIVFGERTTRLIYRI